MQNSQYYKIANETENAGYKHIYWLLNFVFFDHPMSGFNEELYCDDVYEDDVKKSA